MNSSLPEKRPIHKSKEGQSLVEFVLLLTIMFSISYAFVGVFNGHVATLWEGMVRTIATDGKPNTPAGQAIVLR